MRAVCQLLTPHFFFSLIYTFSRGFFFPAFLYLVAPCGSDSEEDEGSTSCSVPRLQRCLRFGDRPGIRNTSVCAEATPRVHEAGLDPWLSLSCCCARHQRPRQLAFTLIGAGVGQSTAQPRGAAPGSPGALVTFPGRTLAPGPLGRSPAEDTQVCIYMILMKGAVLILRQFRSCRKYFFNVRFIDKSILKIAIQK